MVRAILAAIGILFICLGGPGVGYGILFLMPGVITVIVKVVKAINRKAKDKEIWERMEAERKEREYTEEKRKRKAAEEQRMLVERYKDSPITQDVINTICNMNPSVNLPDKIEIFDNSIQADLYGQRFVYSFAANRVHSFQRVSTVVTSRDELRYVVRPQIAMAEAINTLLSHKYEIRDQASERINYNEDYTTIIYNSKSVVLVLKETLPNRAF